MTFQQSVAWWCYQDVDIHEWLTTVKAIGYTGLELLPVEHFRVAQDYGFEIVTHGLHRSIHQGVNNPQYWDAIKADAEERLAMAQDWDIPNLIVFSGNRDGMDDKTGAENAIKLLETLVEDAETAGVMLILELLNSKVDHPDYQCDRTAWGVEVVSAVNSPNLRLLYDIYHMQIMEGNVIQTIRDNHQWIEHYHTAGVPGRHEIDETQELNYRAIAQAIHDTGYLGHLGQEFIPTKDWKTSLKQAYDICYVG